MFSIMGSFNLLLYEPAVLYIENEFFNLSELPQGLTTPTTTIGQQQKPRIIGMRKEL